MLIKDHLNVIKMFKQPWEVQLGTKFDLSTSSGEPKNHPMSTVEKDAFLNFYTKEHSKLSKKKQKRCATISQETHGVPQL